MFTNIFCWFMARGWTNVSKGLQNVFVSVGAVLHIEDSILLYNYRLSFWLRLQKEFKPLWVWIWSPQNLTNTLCNLLLAHVSYFLSNKVCRSERQRLLTPEPYSLTLFRPSEKSDVPDGGNFRWRTSRITLKCSQYNIFKIYTSYVAMANCIFQLNFKFESQEQP